jgi:hypothetical protein
MLNRTLSILARRGAAATAASLALALPFAAPAAAEVCGPRSELIKRLASQYSEAPVAVGLTSGGALLEVLTSDNGATWTIMVSRPDGASCLVAAGESWQPLKRVAGDVGI